MSLWFSWSVPYHGRPHMAFLLNSASLSTDNALLPIIMFKNTYKTQIVLRLNKWHRFPKGVLTLATRQPS